MQEIDFRGRSLQTGEWVYGYYYEHQPPMQCKTSKDYVPEKPKSYILQTGFADWNMPRPVDFIEVDPGTVGQCTGVKDCKRTVKYSKGQPIYVGDIVIVNYGLKDRKENIINEQNCKGYLAIIKFEDGMFTHGWCEPELNGERLYVIGNIYDNPELLEVEE